MSVVMGNHSKNFIWNGVKSKHVKSKSNSQISIKSILHVQDRLLKKIDSTNQLQLSTVSAEVEWLQSAAVARPH